MPDKRNRRIGGPIAIALAAVLVLGVAACGDDDDDGGGGESEKTQIAVIYKDATSAFWLDAADGSKKAAAALGDTAEVSIDAAKDDNDVQGQIAKVENAMTAGADVIAIAPLAPEPLIPVLQRAADQEIEVLLIDTPIPDFDGATSFIGTNNVEAGKLAGQHMIELLGGEGRVGALLCDPGVTSCEDRVEGFKQGLEGSEIEVVAELRGAGEQIKGQDAAQNMLTANPDLTGIFSANDLMALGAITAIKGAGKSPAEVKVIGFDAIAEAIPAIEDGTMAATVAQFPAKMGEMAVSEGFKAADGETIPEVIDTGAEVVDKANAAQFK